MCLMLNWGSSENMGLDLLPTGVSPKLQQILAIAVILTQCEIHNQLIFFRQTHFLPCISGLERLHNTSE